MPVSPIQRAVGDGSDQPEGSSASVGGKSKRKRKSKPTSSRRNKRQKVKEAYSKSREDAQLLDIIPTTPEGALKPERVPPSTQGGQPLPHLVGVAIRNGWAVPEGRKPDLVDELVKILDDPEMPAKVKVAAFNALRQADQAQYERDHPEVVSKMRGGSGAVKVNVSVQTNVAAVELLNKMLDDPSAGLEDLAPPDLPGAPGDSRHQRQVEGRAAPAGDQQGAD